MNHSPHISKTIHLENDVLQIEFSLERFQCAVLGLAHLHPDHVAYRRAAQRITAPLRFAFQWDDPIRSRDYGIALFTAFVPPHVWPGILDTVPSVFVAFLTEPAFIIEDTTFCVWRTYHDSGLAGGGSSGTLPPRSTGITVTSTVSTSLAASSQPLCF